MFITGLGTATPPWRYSQSDCLQLVRTHPRIAALSPRARLLAEKILSHPHGIETRHLALASLEDAFVLTPDALHQRFLAHAPQLVEAAAQGALRSTDLAPDEIDAVIISTCTGYLCPGLTSYAIERLGLRPDVMALDLVGQGCGAALPNLRTGAALLAAGQANHVLSICVEVSSAAFYLDDDPGVLVSACLFGDGAGAAILSSEPLPGRRPVRWITSRTITHPEDRDLLRFEQKGGMLRNLLSLQVPELAAQYADQLLAETLREAGLAQPDIHAWIWHGGGRNVLDALQIRLGLSDADVQWSRQTLSQYGNLSSAFVYFVLKAALESQTVGGWWWLSSFGAGFSCHGALLRVT
jgi:predicted naringenin-chalcone synthase